MKIFTKAFTLLLISLSLNASGQNQYEQPWYFASPSDSLAAAGIDSAYSLLQFIFPEEVVVAVIDAGVDPEHIDLKDNLWVNEDEIPNNGIDDDQNGYVDDIHGWNFLGNTKGENLQGAPYEYVRIYDTLRTRFEGKQISKDSLSESEEQLYELFLEVKPRYEKEVNHYKEILTQYNKILEGYSEAAKLLNNYFGEDSAYTLESIRNMQPDRPDYKWARDYFIKLDERGISRKMIESRVRVMQSILNTKLNPDYHPRKLIGDKLWDMNDSIYGNNDYDGGTASHGTAVAGIIGANRDNNYGIKGIAPKVRIMIIRAIPGGDEWDKDIAMAIRYAVSNGADIINGSFGKLYSPNKYMVDSAIRYAERNDVLIVMGAGNDSKNNDIRDNYPSQVYNNGQEATNVIHVGASTSESLKYMVASFSNYGRHTVDVFAPGVDISALNTNDRMRSISGTSAAAPVVSGIAALIKAYYPEVPAPLLKEIIMESVTDYRGQKVLVPGTNDLFLAFEMMCTSAGVVNAFKAITLVKYYYKQGRF